MRWASSCRTPVDGRPSVGVARAEFGQACFGPGQRLGLDPGPFILRQHLEVEGGSSPNKA